MNDDDDLCEAERGKIVTLRAADSAVQGPKLSRGARPDPRRLGQ
jgi:hypothetical protein